MQDNTIDSQGAIAYYIDFSLQEIPNISDIAYSTGGIIYTDSEKTYHTIEKEYPTLNVMYLDTIDKIRENMLSTCVKVIVYPDYHIRYFKDLKDIKHVQVFHGPNDKKYNYIKEVLEYDLFFIPGYDAYERYKKQDLLKRGTGTLIGYPKLDRVFRGELDRDYELIKMGLDPSKKTILYAPTWHDRALNSSWKSFRNVFVVNIPANLNVIVKPHPNISRYMEKQLNEFRKRLLCSPNTRLFENSSDTVPLMAASDLLIGDVSGITREYLAFKRPFVFLSNKPRLLWSKKKTRLWNCGEVVTKTSKVWEAIGRSLENPDRYMDQIEQFFKTTFYKPDGGAAERARDAIFDLINDSC